jgi:uncharacterized membrane protein YczE
MNLFLDDLKRLPTLFAGFILLALGIYLTKLSGLGMSSWSVFHDGLSIQLNLSFGVITQLLGLIILLFSMLLLKTKVGLGTIFNVIFVGMFIDIFEILIPNKPPTLMGNIIYLVCGVLLLTFGRSLYISSRLGAGPRDGLFVGLVRITKIDVKYVKPAIELVVLIIGYFLGGNVGLGTVLITLVSGYLVQFFFKVLHFDPKTEKQSNIFSFNKKRNLE